MVWQKVAQIKGMKLTLQNKAGKKYDIDLTRWAVACDIPDAATVNSQPLLYWAEVDFNNRTLLQVRENLKQ
jgi:hypothetical protein